MWQVEFYSKPDGTVPAVEFIDSLQAKDRVLIQKKLVFLQGQGSILCEPLVKKVKTADALYELRITIREGIVRFLFFIKGKNVIILTHGFKKKKDELGPEEIKRAIKIRTDYYFRNG